MKLSVLLSLNLNFLSADGIGQNRLGNNLHILNLNKKIQQNQNLAYRIMLAMSSSKAGQKKLKSYFQTLNIQQKKSSRFFLYQNKFKN